MNNEDIELQKINSILKSEINNLNYKLNDLKNEKENIIKENIELKKQNNTLQKLKEDAINKIKNININNNNDKKIIELYEKLEIKEKEIKDLKNKLDNNSNDFSNLMTVIFYSTDHKIHYSLICKKTDTFISLEKQLFETFPECQDSEYFFMVNGQKVNRYKTLEENKIKNSQVITLTQFDLE